MASNKRHLSEFDEPPAKKFADAENEDDDFGGAELVAFQKKQLINKIKYLNKENESRDQHATKLDARIRRLENALSTINQHWDQLSQDTFSLLGRLSTSDTTDEVFEDDIPYTSATVSFLDELRQAKPEIEASAAVDAMLVERCRSVKTVIARLVEAIEKEQLTNEAVYEMVRKNADGEATAKELAKNNEQLHRENQSLKDKITSLQHQLHNQTQQVTEHREALKSFEATHDGLKQQYEDVKSENEVLYRRAAKYRQKLVDAGMVLGKQEASAPAPDTQAAAPSATVAAQMAEANNEALAEMQDKLKDLERLASDRMSEIAELRRKRVEDRNEIDRLRVGAGAGTSSGSESSTVDMGAHRALLQQYHIAARDAGEYRAQAESLQRDLDQAIQQHRMEVEQLKSTERDARAQLSQEVQAAEEKAIQLKNERDRYKAQVEKLTMAKDTDKTVAEMKTLIANLNKHIQHLNQALVRLKKRAGLPVDDDLLNGPEGAVGGDLVDSSKYDKQIEELKASLKKAEEKEKEASLLLNMYKTSSKLTRDMREVVESEKKLQAEVEELREKVRELSELQAKAAEGAAPEFKSEKELREAIQAKDQEVELLMSEIESVSGVYEELSEQNSRLVVQLQQKDDANLDLMAQQIKASQIAQLLRDDRDAIEMKMAALQAQSDSATQALRRLQEKERLLRESLIQAEKDQGQRQQVIDMHRRKAVESTQALEETKAELDRLKQQADKVNKMLSEKNEQIEAEASQRRRLQEELEQTAAKLKRVQGGGNDTDVLLLEEIKAFKDQINCGLCKKRRKNAVLTKCFHIFCMECIKERYDTRQRKCPNCLDPFGANDWHQIFG